MKTIEPELKSWNQGAKCVTDGVVSMAEIPYFSDHSTSEACHKKIVTEFESIVDGVFHQNPKLDEKVLEQIFVGLCTYALIGYAQETKVSVEEAGMQVLQTVIGKQRMYGHGNIARFGIPGLVIRLNDKLERLKNLQKHDGPVLFEPLHDTWLDICGYSVIAIMWINNWFMLELDAESN